MMKTNEKKLLVIVLSLILIMAISSFGLASQDKLEPVTIATGPAGGMYQGLGGIIADTANSMTEGTPFGIVAGGSVPNVTMVAQKEAGIGISLNAFLLLAEKGAEPFTDGPYKNLKALFSLTSSSHHFLVTKDLDNTAKNYKGLVENKLKISYGGAGKTSPSYWIMETIFGYYGASQRAMQEWGAEVMLQSTRENINAWSDGRSDVFNTISMTPASSITEATSTREGVFWDIPEEVINILLKQGYEKWTIPVGTYPGMDKDYNTVAARIVFFANDEVSNEAAYLITKATAESQERLVSTVSSGFKKYWEPERMCTEVGIELHEGAKKYYRERGWLK